jgi:hypothetical protein
MNSKGPTEVPGYKEKPAFALFFVVFIIFCSFFIINLFVGVIISAFNREIEKSGKNFLLTEQQKKWLENKIISLKLKP